MALFEASLRLSAHATHQHSSSLCTYAPPDSAWRLWLLKFVRKLRAKRKVLSVHGGAWIGLAAARSRGRRKCPMPSLDPAVLRSMELADCYLNTRELRQHTSHGGFCRWLAGLSTSVSGEHSSNQTRHSTLFFAGDLACAKPFSRSWVQSAIIASNSWRKCTIGPSLPQVESFRKKSWWRCLKSFWS
jgi:hypothetical protein